MQFFSITGGHGTSVANLLSCGKKVAWKEKGYTLSKTPVAIAQGALFHDAMDFFLPARFDPSLAEPKKEHCLKQIALSFEAGFLPKVFAAPDFEKGRQIDFALQNREDRKDETKDAFERALVYPIKPLGKQFSEIYIETPLIDPRNGKIHFEGEVMICGQIDLIEKLDIVRSKYEAPRYDKDYTKSGKSYRYCIPGENKWVARTKYEREIEEEAIFEIGTGEPKHYVVTDFKTAASADETMYKHLQQIFMYAYLFYMKFKNVLSYGSIIEVPKSGAEIVRHLHPIRAEDICDIFDMLLSTITMYRQGILSKNHQECVNRYGLKCMYFYLCHPLTSIVSVDNIERKFFVKE